MSDGIRPNPTVGSLSGNPTPRFRIVPTPSLNENPRSNIPRAPSAGMATASMVLCPFGTQGQQRQGEMNKMGLCNTGKPTVQYIVNSSGKSNAMTVSGNDLNNSHEMQHVMHPHMGQANVQILSSEQYQGGNLAVTNTGQMNGMSSQQHQHQIISSRNHFAVPQQQQMLPLQSQQSHQMLPQQSSQTQMLPQQAQQPHQMIPQRSPQPQMVSQQTQHYQSQHQAQQGSLMTPANPAEQASMVTKCVRFFRTLMNLSVPEAQRGTAHRVNEIVQLVIHGQITPEQFTERLQAALNSQAQPHLLPFLQKTLPALRTAMQKGELVLEGISPLPSSQLVDNQNQSTSHYEAKVDLCNQQPGPFPQSIALQTSSVSNPSFDVAETKADVPEVETIELEARHLPPNSVIRLLNADIVARKILRAMPDGGQPQDDVITMISEAAEFHLRNLLTQLSVIAEHRLEALRISPFYRVINDTRRQLKFVEELEKREYDKRESREKEALIRLSKSKGKDKDTLLERAKQIQRADQEAVRNREANAAAIAALGGKKSVKRSWQEASNPLEMNASVGLAFQVQRTRTKRVTMKDLQYVINSDPIARNSQLRHRLTLYNVAGDSVPL